MRPLIVANWKMNNGIKESLSYMEVFKPIVKDCNADIAICPPFSGISELKKSMKGTNIKIGAQNMHHEDNGAFTGEVSPQFLKELGCEYVIIGHSERRKHFNETDEFINKKLISALNYRLIPILCVGEDMAQRKKHETKRFIKKQLVAGLGKIGGADVRNIVIAYEPIWAIGTGNNATPDQAEDVHLHIRDLLSKIYGKSSTANVRILYGGSMKPENSKELMVMPNINGGLVGGASLDPKKFAEICMNV
jgi:triosephosphate isomerase (TIM)